jgi:hypothetical protein
LEPDIDPFLLHRSSYSFLRGDPADIQERFRYRRDLFDLLAMAGAAAGALLLVVTIAQWFAGRRPGDDPSALYSSMVLAVLLIVAGMYYTTSRQRAAATKARLIREGQVLPGAIVSCTARDETTTEASLGEVTRSYLVTVEYRFTTPDGHEIADHDEVDRPDLRRADLPTGDTPVRVLYVDDSTYALL